VIVLGWLLVAIAGFAIGATSIGGVLVVPALTQLHGIAVPTAIAAASFAFLLTGALAVPRTSYSQRDRLSRDAPLHLGALCGALAGAAISAWVPSGWIMAWVGLVALGSGLHAISFQGARAPADELSQPPRWPGRQELTLTGLLVGLGSALSGTGGPVLLLPWLLLRRLEIQRAIAAAQLIQIPIALAATGTHLLAQRLELGLGLAVAAVLLAGAWLGRRLAQRVRTDRLRQITALVLICTGLWMLFST
jgi:uncharacterized membrane protein YfcA